MKFSSRNIYISPKATIGHNVRIGHDTVIYDGVTIEDGATIANHCVIGEPLNDYYTNPDYVNPPTRIGAGSLIRSHAIVYAGSEIGNSFSCGHRVTIREESVIGAHCAVGSYSDLQGQLEMGEYSRVHSHVFVGQKIVLGKFVFVYPFTVFTNDPKPPSETLVGSVVGDYTQIATHSTILPGARIGTNCLIGANSVCGGILPDYSLAIGSPAKRIKDVRELLDNSGQATLYPWMGRFNRGMPWAEIGYAAWYESNFPSSVAS
jgi:acetyltransferase-like isoleucine patch superfamily enzyme